MLGMAARVLSTGYPRCAMYPSSEQTAEASYNVSVQTCAVGGGAYEIDLQSFCMSITTSAVVPRESVPSCGQSYGRADTLRSCCVDLLIARSTIAFAVCTKVITHTQR